MKLLRTLLLSVLFSGLAQAAALPGDSLYQLSMPLTAQDGRDLQLDDFRGRPLLVSMFYTSCRDVCPLLVGAMQNLDRSLAPAERERLRVLLVSFDAEHDTPAQLQAAAQRYHVEASRWTLARSSADQVRKLAAALGIQYRALPGGGFNHATKLVLLDDEGRMRAQTEQLSAPDAEFLKQLHMVLAKP